VKVFKTLSRIHALVQEERIHMSLHGSLPIKSISLGVSRVERLGGSYQRGVGPVCSFQPDKRRLYNPHLEQFERSCLLGPDDGTKEGQMVSLFCKDGSYHAFPPNVISNPPDFELTSVSPSKDLFSSEGEEIILGTEQLYLASSFRVSATNGSDVSRRMNVYGFCQSLECLAESIHDAIASRGGCVDSIIEEGEEATNTVVYICLPFLWGVPPEIERLKRGIEKGGGIIHKMNPEWLFQ